MAIHFDLIHATILRENPHRFFDDRDPRHPSPRRARHPPRPRARRPRRSLRLRLRQTATPSARCSPPRSPELAAAWRRTGYPALQELCRTTFHEAAQPRDLPILNWWERLGERADQPTPSGVSTDSLTPSDCL